VRAGALGQAGQTLPGDEGDRECLEPLRYDEINDDLTYRPNLHNASPPERARPAIWGRRARAGRSPSTTERGHPSPLPSLRPHPGRSLCAQRLRLQSNRRRGGAHGKWWEWRGNSGGLRAEPECGSGGG
jgi:hypothetical protein